ncbi:MAG TPA: FAD/NAD(P)-binding oxidoreductase [Acidimicrobiales bacterium]|nr:FAD/NAD(P)-binding oxidoreductase [Acidimicrobiales bacterium]
MTLDAGSTVVIVGGSLAGLRAAETLRAEGHGGTITLIGAEPHVPYDRPPLSKQFLAGSWGLERVVLRPPEKLAALGLDLRLGHRAERLDLDGRTLELDDGALVGFDGLVLATGAQPRPLPGAPALSGVHVLRTLEDSIALGAVIGEAVRVVVVGAGFIGSEVAATCRARGAHVTVVEALPQPLARVLGEEMGAACGALHSANGVELRTGVGVAGLVAGANGGAVGGVALDDGTVLDADVVVVGIGVVPTTAWLEGSGLELADGVVADATLHAAEGVVVAGDVARWFDQGEGALVRIEHWTNAAEQGAVAARSLRAGRAGAAPYVPVPYFWSDQYDTKIQVIGHPRPDAEVVVVEGTPSSGRFVALYGHDGKLVAALGFGRPRQLMAYRPLLEARAGFGEALARTG